VKIHVWTPKIKSMKSLSFLFPILKWKKFLREAGYTFSLGSIPGPKDAQCLLVDSKVLAGLAPKESEQVTLQITTWAKKIPTAFVDQNESTVILRPDLLEVCQRYWKKQIFRPVVSRLPAGQEGYPRTAHRQKLPDHALGKIDVCWNPIYLNFGNITPGKLKILQFWPGLSPFLGKPLQRKVPVKPRRTLHAQFRTDYPEPEISGHRKRAASASQRYGDQGMTGRREYLRNLGECKICLSPFGYGEICHRDFEAWEAGVCLLKPTMHHLETWPDLYAEHETYLPCSHDFRDLDLKIEQALSTGEFLRVARAGHERYLQARENREAFLEKLQILFSPKLIC